MYRSKIMMLVLSLAIQFYICAVAYAKDISQSSAEESYAEYIRRNFPSTNDYLRQDTNTIIEIRLNIFDKSGKEIELLLNDFWKLQTNFCHPIFSKFHYDAHITNVESLCVIRNHTKSQKTYNINILVFIPQHILYWQNVYNNIKDFKHGMKYIIKTKIFPKEKWRTQITSLRIRQLGQVISAYMIDARVNCISDRIYCKGKKLNMTAENVFEYGLAFCEKVLKQINQTKPELAAVFKGCWTWVTSHDGEKTSVRQYLFFSWILRAERNLTKYFSLLVKPALPNKTSDIFTDLNPSIPDYEDDDIRVPFSGNLRLNGSPANWSDDYRLTFSQLYSETCENVGTQMANQINKEDRNLSRQYKGYKFQQIFHNGNKTRLRGYALYTAKDIGCTKRGRYEMASAVQNAINQYYGKNKNESISDIDVPHGMFVRFTFQFKPIAGEDALNEEEENRTVTMCRDIKHCLGESEQKEKCEVASYKRIGNIIKAAIDFNLVYNDTIIFGEILKDNVTLTDWLKNTFNSECENEEKWKIEYIPEPSMLSYFVNEHPSCQYKPDD